MSALMISLLIDHFHETVLDWYDANKRVMPWRGEKDPYRIWISEIMLQQTQVKTVIPYYNRFIQRFPDIETLARSDIYDVLKQWEGLGYYSRARQMHAAAGEIVTRFQGSLPSETDDLKSLPGIGPYTAGAIASIAFGKKASVLDGNIIRFFCRYFYLTENISLPETRKSLWQLAERLLPDARTGDFNEALMEMGAVVCVPKKPDCIRCPVSGGCKAYKLGAQHLLPVKPSRKKTPHFDVTAAIILDDNRFLITLRPLKGLLGGLWEFPGGKCEHGETLTDCLIREIREELNIDIEIDRYFMSVNHAYTHFKITLHVYHCRKTGGMLQCLACDDAKWITIDELDNYAFPAADRKVIDALREGQG